MTVIPVWDNDQRSILRYITYGNWTWEELDAAAEQAEVMLKEAHRQRVHFIADLRESGQFCCDDDILMKKVGVYFAPGRENDLVLVGTAQKTEPFLDIVRQRYRGRRGKERVKFVESLEEARELLTVPVYI